MILQKFIVKSSRYISNEGDLGRYFIAFFFIIKRIISIKTKFDYYDLCLCSNLSIILFITLSAILHKLSCSRKICQALLMLGIWFPIAGTGYFIFLRKEGGAKFLEVGSNNF